MQGLVHGLADKLQERALDTLPPSHYVHLKSASVCSRVLLVHGQAQDHTAWLLTARRLHEVLNHDVLVPDLYGFGRSPYLPCASDLDVSTLVAQLRKLVVEVGWADKRIVLGGISMGGALVQLYSLAYPHLVDRLVLVGSGGLSECWWHPIYAARAAARLMVRLLEPGMGAVNAKGGRSWSHYVCSRLQLGADAPEYRVPQDTILAHLRQFPLSLVWGGLDFVHSAQIERRRDGRDDVNVLTVPVVGHLVCAYVDWLRLEQYPHFWADTATATSVIHASAVLPHSRL